MMPASTSSAMIMMPMFVAMISSAGKLMSTNLHRSCFLSSFVFLPLFFCFSSSLLSSSSSILSASLHSCFSSSSSFESLATLSFLFFAGGSRGSNDVLDRGFFGSADNLGFVTVDVLFCCQCNILEAAHHFC